MCCISNCNLCFVPEGHDLLALRCDRDKIDQCSPEGFIKLRDCTQLEYLSLELLKLLPSHGKLLNLPLHLFVPLLCRIVLFGEGIKPSIVVLLIHDHPCVLGDQRLR